MNGKSGQVSTEMMMLFAFIIFLFIPGLFLVSSKIHGDEKRYNAKLSSTLVFVFAKQIDAVGRAGEGSMLTSFLYLPPSIEKIKITKLNKEGLVKVYYVDGSVEVIPIFVPLDLDGDAIFPGNQMFVFKLIRTEKGVKIEA